MEQAKFGWEHDKLTWEDMQTILTTAAVTGKMRNRAIRSAANARAFADMANYAYNWQRAAFGVNVGQKPYWSGVVRYALNASANTSGWYWVVYYEPDECSKIVAGQGNHFMTYTESVAACQTFLDEHNGIDDDMEDLAKQIDKMNQEEIEQDIPYIDYSKRDLKGGKS